MATSITPWSVEEMQAFLSLVAAETIQPESCVSCLQDDLTAVSRCVAMTTSCIEGSLFAVEFDVPSTKGNWSQVVLKPFDGKSGFKPMALQDPSVIAGCQLQFLVQPPESRLDLYHQCEGRIRFPCPFK